MYKSRAELVTQAHKAIVCLVSNTFSGDILYNETVES